MVKRFAELMHSILPDMPARSDNDDQYWPYIVFSRMCLQGPQPCRQYLSSVRTAQAEGYLCPSVRGKFMDDIANLHMAAGARSQKKLQRTVQRFGMRKLDGDLRYQSL